ncbi:MAG: gamma-glutamyl-gamma-aminobutyrate hydrolase family protein, partial [Desulfonatronovibrionaceae bacterium]
FVIWILRLILKQKALSGQMDAARDSMELEILAAMYRAGKPVLGICRGAQLMNVFFGGTLYQDLMHFYTEIPQLRTILPQKNITVYPQSQLHRITGRHRLTVNALHNQAVHRPAEPLTVCAVEDSGVIQAVEGKDGFLLGVQWHPEFLLHMRAQRDLFCALVDEAHRFVDRGYGLGRESRSVSQV